MQDNTQTQKVRSVAFFVPEFPTVSVTFIINQAADLIDRGIDVQIYAFERGDMAHVAGRFTSYKLAERTQYLEAPRSKKKRIFKGARIALRLLFRHPAVLFRALNISRYGLHARSLFTLFWIAPLVDRHFDVVHCHFGTVANKYLIVREILQRKEKCITSLYGYDVSHIPKEKGSNYYARLAEECSAFIVMSEDMKRRVAALGIPSEKMVVHPISVDVDSYPFRVRTDPGTEPIQIVSVGRFVEKKGFDDLIRALAIVKEKTDRPFVCQLVGDGPLRKDLENLSTELSVDDVLNFRGFMQLEDVIDLYTKSHIYVQPSKTARDGDME